MRAVFIDEDGLFHPGQGQRLGVLHRVQLLLPVGNAIAADQHQFGLQLTHFFGQLDTLDLGRAIDTGLTQCGSGSDCGIFYRVAPGRGSGQLTLAHLTLCRAQCQRIGISLPG